MKKRNQIIVLTILILLVITLQNQNAISKVKVADNVEEADTSSKNPIALIYYDSQLVNYKLYITDHNDNINRIKIIDVRSTELKNDGIIEIKTDDEFLRKKIFWENYIFTYKYNGSEAELSYFLQIFEINGKTAELRGETFLLNKEDRWYNPQLTTLYNARLGILDGKLCLVYLWGDEVCIIDCSDIQNPKLYKKYHCTEFSPNIMKLGYRFALEDEHLIIPIEDIEEQRKLMIIEFSDLDDPKIVSEINQDIDIRAVEDGYLYAYSGLTGPKLSVYNIKDKENPVLFGKFENENNIRSVTVENNYIYLVINFSILRIYQRGISGIFIHMSDTELELRETIYESYSETAQAYRNRLVISRYSEYTNRTFSLIDLGNKREPIEAIIFGPDSGTTRLVGYNNWLSLIGVLIVIFAFKRRKRQK